MGKYLDQYFDTIERQNIIKKSRDDIEKMCGGQTSDLSQVWNEAHKSAQNKVYQQQEQQALARAIIEMKQEIIDEVMNRIAIDIQNNTSKPLQDLDKSIRNILK